MKFISKLKQSRSTWIYPITALIFFIASMTPYLFNGFYTDDSLNSQVRWVAADQGLSIFEFTRKINFQWMSQSARFYPLAWLQTYSYYGIFSNLLYARVAHVLFVGLNVLLFAYLIYERLKNPRVILVFFVLLLSSFQIRYGFDPISSYAPFMQSLFLYYMGALLLQFKHLQTGRAHFLILSAVLYGLSLLVYEISLAILPLLVLHLFVLEKSIKATLLKSSLYFLLVASYLGFIFYLRHQYQVTYTGVMPNWDFKKIFATFRNQFYSGFPLSYYLYNPRPEWINLKKYGFESVSTYLSVVSGMFLFYTGLDTTRHQERVKPSRDYIVICLGLAFLPAALIATSSRWQNYIAPGFGYLPVYFTYFGVTGLVALGLTLIFQSDWIRTIPKSIRLVLKATLTLGVGVVLFISHAANIVIAESMDEHYKYPRNLLSHAYENGLASLLKKNSILVTPQSHQWNNKYVSPSVADKIQSVIEISTFQWNSSFPLYYLNFGNASLEQDHQGWAFLSEFTQIDASFQFLNPVIYVETKKNQSGSIQVSCLSKGQPQVVFQSDLPSQKDDFSILAIESFECSLENIRVENKLFGKPKALLEKLFIPR